VFFSGSSENIDHDVSRYFSQITHSVAFLLYYTTNKKTNNFLLRLVTQNNSIIIKRTLKSTEGLRQTVRGKKEREREREREKDGILLCEHRYCNSHINLFIFIYRYRDDSLYSLSVLSSTDLLLVVVHHLTSHYKNSRVYECVRSRKLILIRSL